MSLKNAKKLIHNLRIRSHEKLSFFRVSPVKHERKIGEETNLGSTQSPDSREK